MTGPGRNPIQFLTPFHLHLDLRLSSKIFGNDTIGGSHTATPYRRYQTERGPCVSTKNISIRSTRWPLMR